MPQRSAALRKRGKTALQLFGCERSLIVLARAAMLPISGAERVDLTLHRFDHRRLALRDRGNVLGDSRLELRAWHQLSEEADAQHLLRAERLRSQKDPLGLRRSEGADETPQAPGVIV